MRRGRTRGRRMACQQPSLLQRLRIRRRGRRRRRWRLLSHVPLGHTHLFLYQLTCQIEL
uniref:Uncharacterized protein n=1 Tax=Arundo donax TaxID=35708 RepID=A0A0A9AJ03_ARUDO